MATRTLRLDQNEHAAHLLRLIGQWGWGRAPELARLLLGKAPFAQKHTEKLLRKLVAMKLVIARPLPGHRSGNAYILSQQGATQLNDWYPGSQYRSSKDWGRVEDGQWKPPSRWRHDLLVTGVMSHFNLYEAVSQIIPERFLRSWVPDASKHPDGIVVFNETFSAWLEVENTRKTGKNLTALVQALAGAGRGKPLEYYDAVQHAPVSTAVVAIDRNARNHRGHNLDHWKHIKAEINRIGVATELTIYVCWLNMRGIGVGSIELEKHTFLPTSPCSPTPPPG